MKFLSLHVERGWVEVHFSVLNMGFENMLSYKVFLCW